MRHSDGSASDANPDRSGRSIKTIRVAAALVVHGSETLLVRKRGTSVFMQPGGKIEPGESPDHALARELAEEIGLTVDPAALMPFGRFEAPAANEPDHMVVADVFRLDIQSRDVKSAGEIEEIRWISPIDPGDLTMASLTADDILPSYRDRLSKG
ncbi:MULTISPECIES: NUDIX domain-containing protein [unclassified Sinorhizobium]|uniref:NUDIX hydrolase n=1 Tax=unclassified Sinorhizobium TaxID=2613772 RepID=UPI0035250109